MSTLDDAKVYVDLPKKLQDEDALQFARAVIALYEIVDRLKGPPFEEAWGVFEKAGYRYGEDALENVRFGFEIGRGRRPESEPESPTLPRQH